MFKYISLVIVVLLLVLVTTTAYMSRPLFSEQRSELPALPAIAPRSQAVTFARTENGLYLVTDIQSQNIEAINISSIYGSDTQLDLIKLYQKIGHDSMTKITGPLEIIDLNELQLPMDFGAVHLAAGTNYKEHSEEVLLDDPPFLFPKNIPPTPWNASIKYTKRLDYEAELAAVPLSTIQSPDDKPFFGLILANDFTDRWTLIKGLNLRKPMGTTGFAASKGQKSFLPTGCFLVIPKDEDFYNTIELRLYVNNKLRQRFKAEDMILKINDIVQQSFVDSNNVFYNGKTEVALIPKEGIKGGSMILTGTAGGVIFKPVNIWWQGIYLKKGDVVRTEASFLGNLENKID
ncbi:MAG: fumarylacetoacetate hydrolase family protein [Chitinophagales bacterium]